MRHFLLGLVLALACATTTLAQYGTAPAPLGITDATYITAVPVSVEITDAQAKKTKLDFTMTLSGRTDGSIEYTMDANTIGWSGDVEIIDAMTTPQVFDVICSTAVRRGVELGYAPSSGSSGVTVASCVTRAGTAFATSGANLNRRVYTYSSTGTVRSGLVTTGSCASGAECTYEATAGIQ